MANWTWVTAASLGTHCELGQIHRPRLGPGTCRQISIPSWPTPSVFWLIGLDNHQSLLNLANNLNRTALPAIPKRYGIRLPPEKDCLTAPNFNIAPKPTPTEVGSPSNHKEGMFGGIDDNNSSDSDSNSGTKMDFAPFISINDNGNMASDQARRRLEDVEEDD
ncbi:uncharacterized protein PGTG_13615 [Puccinia graminis f. sp. tritici CRL 75-36-700-3]|uniref:Transcription initiation factor TFIID subunit 9 n=1 Tax=Puccinia graminis f. sp. tritici (strain CRL 75-36-700-3 / race SCCL) TaxID=418459 RepID=E3KT01_PUCGT|nr:uncharacterized protein PGTG_13615 [Puccinia graminis f. sp. tritici CRL 75-36-700-3]EFP87387.2 hypothetical protein PGTG_13615 [Puccinia graminis f. sp. tritici CRL 75-36-700-3]